jgi:hypothetical protein
VIYFGSEGNWTRLNDDNAGNLTYLDNVSINVTVRDNVEVDENSVRIVIRDRGSVIADARMESKGNDRFVFVIGNLTQTSYDYTISAKDVNDHESSLKGSFWVN